MWTRSIGLALGCRDRTGRHARAHGIRARGENDRHARAEYHSRRVRIGEERQVFGQHVAGFEIGHDENLRAARSISRHR